MKLLGRTLSAFSSQKTDKFAINFEDIIVILPQLVLFSTIDGTNYVINKAVKDIFLRKRRLIFVTQIV